MEPLNVRSIWVAASLRAIRPIRADTLCHLSDIATRLNHKLRWNPVDEKFSNDDEANRKLILRPMRELWRRS